MKIALCGNTGLGFSTMQRWVVVLSALLSSLGTIQISNAQTSFSGACAVFAADGTLATGTLKDGDLETKVDDQGTLVATTHVSIPKIPVGGLYQHCEESFSDDGKWLATVVPSKELTVVIFDRKAKSVHRSFSSDWYQLRGAPIEVMYKSSFLGGFLQDDSLLLWRYVPRAVTNTTDASNANLHLQRWNVDGELLSDQDLGDAAWGPYGRQPILDGVGLLWRPSTCGEVFCYKGIHFSAGRIEDAGILKWPKDNADEPVALPASGEFLSVLGRTNQKAVILDSSWGLKSQLGLPYFPSLLGPLVPNWFQDLRPALSHDGEVAAIGRTRVAWVLVDTDRDWGSEIVLLKTHPLAVSTKVKTGKGGITAIAVDHRNGILRLVGFWKQRWHDLRCDEQHPDKCHE